MSADKIPSQALYLCCAAEYVFIAGFWGSNTLCMLGSIVLIDRVGVVKHQISPSSSEMKGEGRSKSVGWEGASPLDPCIFSPTSWFWHFKILCRGPVT